MQAKFVFCIVVIVDNRKFEHLLLPRFFQCCQSYYLYTEWASYPYPKTFKSSLRNYRGTLNPPPHRSKCFDKKKFLPVIDDFFLKFPNAVSHNIQD